MRLALALVAALLVPASLTAQAPAKNPIPALERYIEEARRQWEVPGLAIAIVKDDSVVLMRGFGLRELGKPDPVDAQTLFAIASCSKAFTATLVGMLVKEGKLSWDDPATEHLPGFQLYDPYATRELTVRDLLSHRSGLSRGDLIWYASGFSREEVLRRVRLLKPSWSFRSAYGYQNIMFLAAGEIASRIAGHSWDRAIRERFFLPMGMLASNTSVTALEGRDNVATPHQRIEKVVTPIAWRNVDNVGSAGAINSNVAEMAQWVRLQLGRGMLGDRRLVDSTIIEETWQQQTVIPRGGLVKQLVPSNHFSGYGLGWFLMDYRGRLVVQHGGNLDGMSAYVALMPEERLGFVMLSNMDGSPLRTPLQFRIFDAFLGGPERDWSGEWKAKVDSLVAEEEKAQARTDSSRVAGTSPSLGLERYAGKYTHPMYGELNVAFEDDHLVLTGSPAFQGDLTHWHYDTFRVTWRDRSMGRNLVTFHLDSEGKVRKMTTDFEGEVDYGRLGE